MAVAIALPRCSTDVIGLWADAAIAPRATCMAWHLALMAVRPSMQRAGMGSALLQHQHVLLDQWGLPAYLEAADPTSRRLYSRHGYLDHGEPFPCTPAGPLLYPMWRQPSDACFRQVKWIALGWVVWIAGRATLYRWLSLDGLFGSRWAVMIGGLF